MRALLVALVAVPLLILGACAGLGYEPPPVELTPEQRTAEAIVWCKRAGFPVVRLEVDGPRTLVRCASLEVTVMTKGGR